MDKETIGRRLRRYADQGITPNKLELTLAADSELWAELRIKKLEAEVDRLRKLVKE